MKQLRESHDSLAQVERAISDYTMALDLDAPPRHRQLASLSELGAPATQCLLARASAHL